MDIYNQNTFKRSNGHCPKDDDGTPSSDNDHGSADEYKNRYSTTGQVSFTIGDSSDCDSVSTVTSNSVLSPTPNDNTNFRYDHRESNCCNDNPWHKYHFHVDCSADNDESQSLDKKGRSCGRESDNEISGETDDDDPPSSCDGKRIRGFSVSTSRMIQNSENYSLAQLTEIDFQGSMIEESDGGCYSRDWGKWRILIACAIVQLLSALMVSLQAPFYPAEAEKKGATATQYGFVFGVFELTVFLVAPCYGSRIHEWDPKLVFNLGIFTAAISSIAFSVLDRIEDGRYFIAACSLVRVLEALGESAVITSSFVIVASTFSDNVASTFALLEIFYSIGLIAGPLVGSLLYQIGGYSLPFMVVGGALLAAALLNFVILPSSEEISEYRSDESVIISSYKSFRLLAVVPVLVSATCIIIGAMSISYLQATLEPHLRQFDLSQLSVGAILIINGAVYTITAPFWGIVCDKVLQLKLITFCGSALLVCGYSLVGPIPILPFKPTVWIIALGLALQGIGLGAVLVASFISILRCVICKGLPDTPSTYGLVSSLWTSMFSLGSFLGPSLSGILYDTIGFSTGTLSIIVLSLIMMSILILFVCTSDAEMESFNLSENSPLLSTSVAASASIYSEHPPIITSAPLTNGQRHRSSYGSV